MAPLSSFPPSLLSFFFFPFVLSAFPPHTLYLPSLIVFRFEPLEAVRPNEKENRQSSTRTVSLKVLVVLSPCSLSLSSLASFQPVATVIFSTTASAAFTHASSVALHGQRQGDTEHVTSRLSAHHHTSSLLPLLLPLLLPSSCQGPRQDAGTCSTSLRAQCTGACCCPTSPSSSHPARCLVSRFPPHSMSCAFSLRCCRCQSSESPHHEARRPGSRCVAQVSQLAPHSGQSPHSLRVVVTIARISAGATTWLQHAPTPPQPLLLCHPPRPSQPPPWLTHRTAVAVAAACRWTRRVRPLFRRDVRHPPAPRH